MSGKGSARRPGTGFETNYDGIDWGRKEGPEGQQRTGWPPGMLQDDSYPLAHALSSKPDARQHVRDVAADVLSQRWSKEAEFYASMPPAKTCQHCKHWSEANQPVGFGCCLNEWLVSPADFGCSMWEPKP